MHRRHFIKQNAKIYKCHDELDAMSDDAFILRMMMADSFETKFDASGRIVIPETLMNFAELSNKAVFMGIGEIFLCMVTLRI